MPKSKQSRSKSPSKTQAKPRTAEEFLKVLRTFFKESKSTKRFSDQQKVWQILTALRGPDDEGPGSLEKAQTRSRIKAATTAVIRRAVFGEASAVDSCAITRPDTTYSAEVRLDVPPGHFGSHVEDAFNALGLNWGGVNEGVR
jgi:hypothetical protein